MNAVIINKTSTTGLNHITNSQSGKGGDRGIITDASWLNQDGGGGIGFRDRSALKDGNWSNAQVADRGTFFRVRTESTVLRTMNNMIFCDSVEIT